MKIVHAASELFPFVKTGGLADAVGALSAELAERGHEVTVFLPGYRSVMELPEMAATERRFRLKIEMGEHSVSGEVRVASPRPGLTLYLICREEYFDRRHPYGNGERDYEDNAERFIFFSKAVVETLRLSESGVDILHAHDWQTALVPIFLREAERRSGANLAMRTLFTVHNIAFQGIYPASAFPLTNLPEELNTMDGLEYYGQVNLLKAGILFADRITTVSPRYSREIQTPEFGCGLEGVVQARAEDLSGFLNGIDTATWNPATDAFLPARYSAADLSGKKACRAELFRRCGFDPAFEGPAFGMICRLTEQKGVDVLLANKDFFLAGERRLVVLGTGDKRFEDELKRLAASAPDRVHLCLRLDEGMSHLVEAGSDFFLMPSHFEPCGLNQMYSQVYGTVPIVTRVGGLADTVVDFDDSPESGTGIVCANRAVDFRGGLERAVRLFADKARLEAVRKRGMQRDFSWRTAAVAFETLYRDSL